ncbi:unnamed protein product [Toxocara canis]|uniref:Membrane magnesium transporter n=1 Tax=Toxocara canis TaxID=6265 RepID=A0A183U270_TOXCA|nr:unnamed protein product [Toxocara canis]
MTSLLRIITIVALVSLLHCAYSAAQHRFYLRLTEQPFTQLPADLIVQTLVSLIILIYGASYVAGDFQPIRTDIQVVNRTKSWDTVGNCPSFYTFEHRAKALSPTFSALRKQCYDDTHQVCFL